VANLVLRILVVLNWLSGAAILTLLIAMPISAWIRSALDLPEGPGARPIIIGLHAVAVIGLLAIALNYIILKRLVAIVETVREGDPVVAANAIRLQAIAWSLITLQVLSLAVAAIGRAISTSEHPFHFDAGFSINGWLAVLLTFVLASVFANGARMRDDLAGTV
jgi:hypothetical protein